LGSAIVQWIALFAKKPWLKGIGLVGGGARLRVHPDFLDGLAAAPAEAQRRLAQFCLATEPDPELLKIITEKYIKASPELLHGDLAACNAFDVMDQLERIDLPTLIIVGEEDKLTPVKYSKHLNQAVEGSIQAIIPRAGHLVMLEQPKQFNDTLREFLASKFSGKR
jgi:pimeloyl-ACP methyl ester carboxylesterase